MADLTGVTNNCDEHNVAYANNDNGNIDIITFNCNGFKSSLLEIKELALSNDIICLQETWLDQSEINILNDVSDNWNISH